MPADCRFRVLGPLEVTGDGGLLALGSPRQRMVLAVLLAAPSRVVSTDRLVDEVWGDRPPAGAVHSLQTYLSNLRRLFGEHGLGRERIETRAPGYLLAVDPDDIDAQRFESQLGEVRSLEEDETAVALLEDALSLWRGRAYEEFPDGDTLHIEGIRLEELRFGAMEHRFACLVRLGRLYGVIAELQTYVAGQPLRERPRALLMEALSRSGRQPDALTVYRDYRELVVEELGLEPSRALQDLEIAILRDEVERPPAPSTPMASVAMPEMHLGTLERAPGERIAYGVLGEGPVMVKPIGWFSHLAVLAAGLDPLRSPLFAGLAADFRIVTYDRYGVGLSRGAVADFSFETSVAELVTVMETLDLRDTIMFGESAAAAIAIGATAMVPERVSRLVLLGGYASGPDLYTRAVLEHVVGLVETSWGLGAQLHTSLLYPGANADLQAALTRLQRKSATREVPAGYLAQQGLDADVSHLLPHISVPALILHYRGDLAVPFGGAEQLATGLPDARLVPLEGTHHLPPPGQVERVVELIARFCSST